MATKHSTKTDPKLGFLDLEEPISRVVWGCDALAFLLSNGIAQDSDMAIWALDKLREDAKAAQALFCQIVKETRSHKN